MKGSPEVVFFKPAGVPLFRLREVVLALDEFEAIRLADGEGLEHEKAAARMGVSRPTFTRIIRRARKKVAYFLNQGTALRIEGGPVVRSDLSDKKRRCCKACAPARRPRCSKNSPCK